jgi:hypothetical protein
LHGPSQAEDIRANNLAKPGFAENDPNAALKPVGRRIAGELGRTT